jgi:hypothetical protein
MKLSVAEVMARIEIAPDDAAAVVASLKQKGIFPNSVEIRHGEEIKRCRFVLPVRCRSGLPLKGDLAVCGSWYFATRGSFLQRKLRPAVNSAVNLWSIRQMLANAPKLSCHVDD